MNQVAGWNRSIIELMWKILKGSDESNRTSSHLCTFYAVLPSCRDSPAAFSVLTVFPNPFASQISDLELA